MEYTLSLVLLISLTFIFYEMFLRKDLKTRRSIKFLDTSAKIELQIDKWLSENKSYSYVKATEDLLKRSRLRVKSRPLNKYIFFMEIAIVTVIVAIFATIKLNNLVAGILIAAVTIYLHYHILIWDTQYKKRQLRKQTPNFFLMVINFYQVHHDVLLALKETSKKIKNPLKTDLKFLVLLLQNGDMTIKQAINETKGKLDNKLLKDFLDDLELQIKYGGDFSRTLHTYIEEAIEREKEIMERESETSGTALVTYFLFGIFFFLAYMMSQTQPDAMKLLVTHIVGKVSVVIIILIMLAVLYVTKELTQVEDE